MKTEQNDHLLSKNSNNIDFLEIVQSELMRATLIPVTSYERNSHMDAMKHVRFFAEFIGPRGSTTPREKDAALYAEKVLKDIGLKPITNVFKIHFNMPQGKVKLAIKSPVSMEKNRLVYPIF